MAKKLTVKTDVGTFTRSTVRTYTHIVVVKGYRSELLEAARLAEIKMEREQAARYEEVIRVGFDKEHSAYCAEWLAEGKYVEWAASSREAVAQLEARGPVTEDGNNWSDFNPRYKAAGKPAEWFVLGWCGRADLAAKLASTKEADRFREVRVYAIDGTRVGGGR